MKKKIRTISIVAHVDHGKSTLCDAIIEQCIGTSISSQTPTLDSHLIEKARGVTIRNHFIRLNYKNNTLNIIDTPGHSDLACFVEIGSFVCDGVILLIDITKGIQAQTISYLNLCQKYNKKIIVALNKIDLEILDKVSEVKEILRSYKNIEHVIEVSAKTRKNINLLLETMDNTFILKEQTINSNIKFIIIDHIYNKYHGNILFVKIEEGHIKKNSVLIINKKKYVIQKIAYKEFNNTIFTNEAINGDLCYLYIDINIEDKNTILGIEYNNQKLTRVIKLQNPYTYINIYAKNTEEFPKLENIILRLKKAEHGVSTKTYNSNIYGSVIRCGFYGEFHQDIFIQKLKLETNIEFNIINSEIEYLYKDDSFIIVPDSKQIAVNYRQYLSHLKTPFYNIKIQSKNIYYSKIISYIQHNVSCYTFKDTIFTFEDIILIVNLPISYINNDLQNVLKGITNGYTDIIIDNIEYKNTKLSLIEFLINKELFPELSYIEIHELAYNSAVEKSKIIINNLQRQQYLLVLNIMIDKKIVFKHIIQPFRKDVEKRCNGGDATRRKKLLNKQKEGKAKMLQRADINKIRVGILKNIVQK
ncbi:Elongation factor 4 [bacterium AB1]|nr:Elongation factor 4 [bacterium AB1]